MSFVFFDYTAAAVLYAGSASQTVVEGRTFVVDWFLDTEGGILNTLDLRLKFSSDTLEALEAGLGQSVLNLWIRPPEFSNDTGTISLTGGAAGGFLGQQAPIFRTVFRAKKTGTAKISMEMGSQALLADGRGTPDTLTFRELAFAIAPAGSLPVEVISATHPEQDEWYRSNNVKLEFSPRPGEIYSHSFSSNPEIFPDDTPDEVKSELQYENLSDGMYYFKLNARAGSVWQEAGFYRVQIDATAPEEFQPILSRDQSVYKGREFISFASVDKTSGISHYEIESWPFFWKQISSPYQFSRSLVRDSYRLRAYDLAGNYRGVAISVKPLLPAYIWLVLLVALGLSIFRKQIWKKISK